MGLARSHVVFVGWVRTGFPNGVAGEFRLVFGGSTPATAAVLSIFMAGLGIGNAWLGGYVQRHRNPFRLYGIFEGIIAITAALSPLLIYGERHIYIWLGGQEMLGFVGATVVRLLLSTAVLLIPTICMGGTLPGNRQGGHFGGRPMAARAAIFYGINTLGAVFGTMISTFFLTERLGIRGTLWVAASVNATLSIVAIRTNWSAISARKSSHAIQENKMAAAVEEPRSQVPAAFIYFSAAVVGTAFFLMEMVWYRMLGPLLGGTTFTFGLILAAALFGIGLGGASYAWLSQKFRVSLTWFVVTCALEAVCIAFPFAWGDDLAFFASPTEGCVRRKRISRRGL